MQVRDSSRYRRRARTSDDATVTAKSPSWPTPRDTLSTGPLRLAATASDSQANATTIAARRERHERGQHRTRRAQSKGRQDPRNGRELEGAEAASAMLEFEER